MLSYFIIIMAGGALESVFDWSYYKEEEVIL